MPYRTIIFIFLVTAILPGCVATPPPTEKIAAQTWNFPIEGQLDSISVSDLAAAIRAVDAPHIYRLYILNHNKVEADTTPLHGAFDSTSTSQIVERVQGRWKATDHTIIMSY